MQYLNQLEYPHLPYYTKVKREDLTREQMQSNVARSGCGLCSVSMAVELLTDKTLPIEDCVKLSEGCLANYGVGTDMDVLGPVVAEKFGLCYKGADELEEAIACLRDGGAVISRVGVPEGADKGLFTNGAHYILLVATDGREFCILDPSYTPEKFHTPWREGRVDDSHAPYLYADVREVHEDTRPGRTKYHLFTRRR